MGFEAIGRRSVYGMLWSDQVLMHGAGRDFASCGFAANDRLTDKVSDH